MDNLGNNDKPIPFDDPDKPDPRGNSSASGSPGVSRAPLSLGGGGASQPAPAPKAAPKPAPKIATPAPSAAAPAAGASAGERITGVKTFFTKLHAGAMEFLDESIGRWLQKNPEVHIKHTNITTGDVQGKKTEPNIIITVWY
jgi:hypothetical protein